MQPYYIHAKKIPPNILLNGTHITQTNHVKYLGLHLDTQLTWKLHTKSIIEKIQKTRRQMHWLTSRKSKLSIENKLKIYKTIIKPIWTYEIRLWETAAMNHINKIEVIQAKILGTIVNGPWYVRHEDIWRDLGIPTVKEEISRYSEKYKSRIATHPNRLTEETFKTINMDRRRKRKHPADLIKDITWQTRGWYPAVGSHQHVNITVKKILPNVQIGQIVNFNK